MLKHIVMIKLLATDKVIFQKRLEKLQTMLNNLKDVIPQIAHLEVGANISTRPSAYDLVLVTGFYNETDLNTYRVHPNHQEVLLYMKEIISDAKVVDYIM